MKWTAFLATLFFSSLLFLPLPSSPAEALTPTPISAASATPTPTAGSTPTSVATATPGSSPVVPTPTPTPTPIPTASPTVEISGGFQIKPMVRLRPVNDVIDRNHDGIVELFFRNPSSNDDNMRVNLTAPVPSGVHVYGRGFSTDTADDAAAGRFEVSPGEDQSCPQRTSGEFSWPGGVAGRRSTALRTR